MGSRDRSTRSGKGSRCPNPNQNRPRPKWSISSMLYGTAYERIRILKRRLRSQPARRRLPEGVPHACPTPDLYRSPGHNLRLLDGKLANWENPLVIARRCGLSAWVSSQPATTAIHLLREVSCCTHTDNAILAAHSSLNQCDYVRGEILRKPRLRFRLPRHPTFR
jgi:hypothetical protein